MIGTASVAKAVVAAWSSHGLDTLFKSYWQSSIRADFQSLNMAVGEGKHPFPYCVYEISKPTQSGQMSDGVQTLRAIWDVPLMLRIHAEPTSGGISAAVLGSTLMEEVTKIFGGHPTTANQLTGLALDYGNILVSQLTGEFAIREDLENAAWQLNYNLQIDVPAAQ